MAQTKERQAPALTLAAQRPAAEALILRALGRNASANSPASLPGRLATPLAASLAEGPDARDQAAMGTRLPKLRAGRSRLEFPAKADGRQALQPGHLRALSPNWRRQRLWPQPGPILREPGPIPGPPGVVFRPAATLGPPLNIQDVAGMLGCSPWTVRQTLIPRGLPHFRFRASGRLTFYQDQVIRWIENQQGGNTTS
jgi:hypothetical protein